MTDLLRTLMAEYNLDDKDDAKVRIQTSQNQDDCYVEFTGADTEAVWFCTVEAVENLIKVLQDKLPDIKETFYATAKDAARF